MLKEQILVSAWQRSSAYNNNDLNARLGSLEHALKMTTRVLDRYSNEVGSMGLVRAIFVAPEYFFAASISTSTGRGVKPEQFEGIKTALMELSAEHRRILIVPGTIAWWNTLERQDVERFTRHHLLRIQRSYYKQQKHNGKNSTIPNCEPDDTKWLPFMFDLVASSIRQNEGIPCVANVRNGAMPPVLASHVKNWWMNEPGKFALALKCALPKWKAPLVSPVEVESTWNDFDSGQIKFAFRNSAFVFLNGGIKYQYDKITNANETTDCSTEYRFVHGDESGVKTIEGLRIGFEICRDHSANALPELIRPNLKGRLDLHIVVSDYVNNRSAGDDLLRSDGYKIHASTRSGSHGVWQKTNGILQSCPALCKDSFEGDLSHWLIEMSNDSSLADTFMVDY